MSYRELIRREAMAAAGTRTCASFASRPERAPEATLPLKAVSQSELTNTLISSGDGVAAVRGAR